MSLRGLAVVALMAAIIGCTPASPLATSSNGGATLPSSSTSPSDASPALTWTAGPTMGEARVHHTATLMPDGTLLIVGGAGVADSLTSVERYDPATASWSATGDMSEARAFHTATLLSDGRVMVAGGSSNRSGLHPLATAELYDPGSGSWTAAEPMSVARASHTATLLDDGRVLLTGGAGMDGDPLASAELFDPTSGAWSDAGTLTEARIRHTATLLLDGTVLVTGGSSDRGLRAQASAESFDPASESWTAVAAMGEARTYHTATLLPDGKVLVAGGNTEDPLAATELYDPGSGQWTASAAMLSGRAIHSALPLADGTVLVVGGRGRADQIEGPISLVELFDPDAGSWTAAGNLIERRSVNTATLLADGTVLVAGGRTSGFTPMSSTEIGAFTGES